MKSISQTPWTTHQDGIVSASGELLATVYAVDADHGMRYGMGASDANARLIASAPDMLDILRTVKSYCDTMTQTHTVAREPWMDRLDAVLSHAHAE